MANKEEEWRKDFQNWMQELKEWQESDVDQRENARECDRFLLEKDGQWEDDIARTLDSQKRPRYTFDKCTPVLESMMADVEDMDFGCSVKPGGSGADKETALKLEGMIRAIENESRADSIYRGACRRLMRRGFDAWMIRAKYADEWSFEQDLYVVPIPNAINRVWSSNACKKADSSDSEAMYVLSAISKAEYESRWPDRQPVSVDDYDEDRDYDNYQPDVVVIAERFYKSKKTIEVAQLNDGSVIKIDDEFEKVKDELLAQGKTVVKTKKIDDYTWYYSIFDGDGIIEKDIKTPFKSNPIITVYGNYEHIGSNSKITYSGFILKEIDAQRVHNYAKSREIEEGALAPRSKWWMTKKQAKGNEDQIARMNISPDPVQFYTPDQDAPPPFYQQVAQANPHLNLLGNQMASDIKEQAGVFSAMQGDFSGRMSEETVRMQIDRGTASTRKWVNALIDGIRRTCEVLVETIPVVYDTKRQFTILGIDGTEEDITLNEEIYDQQTGQLVKVNDLNKGKYKIVCDAGPAFSNRLEAGLSALLKYAEIDPTVVQQAGDLMLKSIDAPMVDQVAERKRAQLLQAGQIPLDQMTEEEKEKMLQAAQQNQSAPPSVEQILAQAEALKAQNEQIKLAQDAQFKSVELQLKAEKQQTERLKAELQAVKDMGNSNLEQAKAVADIENTNADTMKKLAETEKTSGESVSQQIDNMKSVTPQVGVITITDT